jgi:hypothetical protein
MRKWVLRHLTKKQWAFVIVELVQLAVIATLFFFIARGAYLQALREDFEQHRKPFDQYMRDQGE